MEPRRQQHILIAAKAVTIASMVALLLFLTTQKLVLGNSLTYAYNFRSPQPFVEGFIPAGRVTSTDAGQQVWHEPIHLRIYEPRRFKRATVALTYRNDLATPVNIGFRTGVWAFDFQKLPPTESKGATIELSYDVTNVAHPHNKVELFVSAPGIDTAPGKLTFQQLTLTFFK